jgi:hypothetical protein
MWQINYNYAARKVRLAWYCGTQSKLEWMLLTSAMSPSLIIM